MEYIVQDLQLMCRNVHFKRYAAK